MHALRRNKTTPAIILCMVHNTLEIPVVYEDEDLIIINKPAGVVVNRSDTYTGFTVQDWIEQRSDWSGGQGSTSPVVMEGESVIFGDPQELFDQRSGIIHRLDRETSGVMMIAKSAGALVAYMSQFKNREVTKTYLALVHGKVNPADGIIELPIGRNSGNRLQFAVREDGKESRTSYHVVEYYPHFDSEKVLKSQQFAFAEIGNEHAGVSRNFKRASKIYQGFTLVEVTPKTGRTHQIRVHFSHMKHPLVGDKVYSGSKRKVIDSYWCPRHFLHAAQITFRNIRTKSEQKVSAPLPDDLEKVMQFLVQ